MNNQIKTSEAITIRYITKDAQRLRAEAKAAGCSLSELIRERSLRADTQAESLKKRIQKSPVSFVVTILLCMRFMTKMLVTLF